MSKQGMRVVALISGGKDSCYNMMECVKNGHQIVGLANLRPEVQGEMDSFMYQTVGQEGISLYAEAMGLPLFRRTIKGSSRCTEMNYKQNDEDEVEDLYHLLAEIKQSLEFDAVSSGTILSNYQRIRVENICARLQLVSLAYLWRRDQGELLEEMVNNHVHAVLIKTASLGLKPSHLGKSLQQMKPHLIKLNELYDCHICGEGGEYETFTLDCPIFKKKISIQKSLIVSHSDDDVAYLNLQELCLEDKPFADTEKIAKEQLEKDNSIEVVEHVEEQEQVTEQPVEWIFDRKKSNHVTTSSVNVSENGQFLSLSASIFHENDLSDEEIVDATNKLLHSISNALESHEHDRSNVTYVHLYLQSMKHFTCINSAYINFFTTSPPARVCVCTDFNQREDEMGILLKFDCISNKESSKREAMHVQSISYWAPSNIGPYSQCVRQDKMLCVAGQIGFIPEKMTIEAGEVRDEARLSLQHVQSVLDVMKSNLAHVESCVCYVTRTNYFKVAAQVLLSQEPTLRDAGELLFVQISTLPRNARVEWQMISKEQSLGDEEEDISMEFHSFYHESCDKDLVAVEVFTSLLESLRDKLLRRSSDDHVISSQARLFFVGGNMSCTDADNVGRLALKATFPDEQCGNGKVAVSPPNLITIPVKSIWKPCCEQRPLVAVLKCIVNYRSQS